MSERGSFTTEYMHCPKCFEAAKKILLGNEKYLCSVAIPSWEKKGRVFPIIAGKIGGLGCGDELIKFEWELIPELEKLICHPIRIAVLVETGEKIFIAKPLNEDDK